MTCAPNMSSVSGFLDKIRFRGAAAKYKHTEFEGDEVGTVFRNKGVEGRLELVQRDRGGWRGASGGAIFPPRFRGGRRGGVPAAQQDQAARACSRSRNGRWARSGSKRRLRYDAHQRPLERARLRPRLRRAVGRGGRVLRGRAAGQDRRQSVAHRRARRRPRNCCPTARTSRPRRSRSAIRISRRKRASAPKPMSGSTEATSSWR